MKYITVKGKKLNRIQALRRWVKALRSGRYKQSTGTMRNKSGYCCLGVACASLARTRWVGIGNLTDYNLGFRDFLLGCDEGAEHECFLITKNDRDRNGFSEIADYIQDNLIKETSNG